MEGGMGGMVEMRNAYKHFIGKPERKGPFRRPKHRRDDNIKTDHTEVGL
jgi:hypothetical protein